MGELDLSYLFSVFANQKNLQILDLGNISREYLQNA